MKKFILFLTLTLILITLVSCGRDTNDSNTIDYWVFLIIESVFLLLVFFGYPFFCLKKQGRESSPLRGT